MTEFIPARRAHIGACMDVCACGGLLYVLQNSSQHRGGRLCVLSPELVLLGEYTGIGNARQLAAAGTLAAATAREDGLWLFDISDTQPRLLSHYRTVEYATGITLYANFALVSCRQYGVEIVDISDPAKPRHIGLIRTGEIQSACVSGGYLYGGIWGAMSVAVIDIRDISLPRTAALIPLQGRGDGVTVKDGILYAVTGQHGRGIRNVSDETDPLYGMGNGVEMFDVSDPAKPRRLHAASFGKCYNAAFDMWRPSVCGELLLCGCSSLGLFACGTRTLAPRFHLTLPRENGAPDAVTGFSVCGGKLYISTGRTDLFLFESEEPVADCFRELPRGHIDAAPQRFTFFSDGSASLAQRYAPTDAPVLSVCEADTQLALACGSGGIRLLGSSGCSRAADGFCCDVKYGSGYLFAAQGEDGAWIYRLSRNTLHPVSRVQLDRPVQQLALSPDGNFLLCGCGSTEAVLLDVTDKAHPAEAARRRAQKGPLYGDNFASGVLADQTMLMFWHRDGLVAVRPAAQDAAFRTISYQRQNGFMGFGPESGFDTDGKLLYYTMKDGYVLLPPEDNIDADTLPVYRSGVPIAGKITLCGHLLAAAERARGIISVTDVSDPFLPRHVCAFRTSASPGKPVSAFGRIWIPGGWGGLLEIQL